MPDKYEPGSHNAIGIAGLNAGVGYLLQQTVESIRQHDRALCRQFIAGLDQIENLQWYGPRDLDKRIAVFSVRIAGCRPQELSAELEDRFAILTRSGLHCAPLAHKTIGTLDHGGTTRLSFGPFVTLDDIDYTIEALAKIATKVYKVYVGR